MLAATGIGRSFWILNSIFNGFFQVERDSNLGHTLDGLGLVPRDLQKLIKISRSVLTDQTSIEDSSIVIESKKIDRREMIVIARPVRQGTEEEQLILLALKGLTSADTPSLNSV